MGTPSEPKDGSETRATPTGEQPLWHKPFTIVFGRKRRLHRAKVATASLLSAVPGGLGDRGAALLRRVEDRAPRREQSLQRFATRLENLTPHSVCIDAGANLGVYTRMMAMTGATVHAYEPDPWTFAKLVEVCNDLPNVVLHNKAIGLTAGAVPLTRPEGWEEDREATSQSVRVVDDTGQAARGPIETDVVVDMVAFETVLSEIGPVDIIKMDIEGAELPILEAIARAPDRYPFKALFVETHENIFPGYAVAVGRLVRLFAGLQEPVVDLDWP